MKIVASLLRGGTNKVSCISKPHRAGKAIMCLKEAIVYSDGK